MEYSRELRDDILFPRHEQCCCNAKCLETLQVNNTIIKIKVSKGTAESGDCAAECALKWFQNFKLKEKEMEILKSLETSKSDPEPPLSI